MRDVLIGTAGHIDHGKTTLLKALTGIDTDRLAEEKRRGITIDLGFAHLERDDTRLGFVDVPGHERFVKNMLAGVGGIRLVLLVVAADESVMPQTREHFDICRLLGVPGGVIALTKAALVDEELLELVAEEVRELVADSFLDSAPVVPVDSLTGEGLQELAGALVEQARSVQPDEREEAARHAFRLPVDRVFSLRGFGTVVTGTAVSGTLETDTSVQAFPSGPTAKVRSIQVFDRKQPRARSGQRTALNLAGVDKEQLARGMVLSQPGALAPSPLLDVLLELLPDAPAPLENGSPVRLHHGSGEILGRAFPLEGAALEPGGRGLVQLRLRQSAVCCPGDRFIIRRYSPMRTIGGGTVLDNAPAKHKGKQLRETVPALRDLSSRVEACRGAAADTEFARYAIERAAEEGVELRRLAARLGMQDGALAELLAALEEIEVLPAEPRLAITRHALARLEQRLSSELERHHRDKPLEPGIPQPELKSRCLPRAPDSLFQSLLERLRQSRRAEVTAGTVRAFGRRVELSPEQSKLKESILARFMDERLQSPSLPELARDLNGSEGEVRDLYYLLLRDGELVRVSQDLVLSRRQLDWVSEQIEQRFRSAGAFGVGEFKDLFGVTRRYAIPLLEYLDRQRITRRAGDKRILL